MCIRDRYGVPLEKRGARFEEQLAIVKALWTQERVSFKGTYYTVDGRLEPKPVAKPHPPIWIGGNGTRARQRVANRGQGWCPFPAPALLARTARTAALDTRELLAEAIGDLHARLDAAGRDPASVDITFGNPDGGSPATDAFDADAHLAGLAQLAALGVTWVQVALPGDSLAHAVETVERYGKAVIARA